MGCVTSHSTDHHPRGCRQFGVLLAPQNRVRGGRNSQSKLNNHDDVPIEILLPDPDLGWRRVSGVTANNGCIPHTYPMAPSAPVSTAPPPFISTGIQGASHEAGPGNEEADFGQTGIHHTTIEYPAGWLVYFFNDRSGHAFCVSLATLAINISIRAQCLAQAFGLLKDTVQSASPCITGADEENSQGPPRQLSPKKNELIQSGASSNVSPVTCGRRQIYVCLGIPDFGWNLLNRNDAPIPVSNAQAVAPPPPRRIGGLWQPREIRSHTLTLQLLQRVPQGTKIRADIPTVGVNIAEQLYRLERKRDDRHSLPVDTFGWTFHDSKDGSSLAISATSPNGETVSLVPEEMIMNVTQWVQQTYLTSTIL